MKMKHFGLLCGSALLAGVLVTSLWSAANGQGIGGLGSSGQLSSQAVQNAGGITQTSGDARYCRLSGCTYTGTIQASGWSLTTGGGWTGGSVTATAAGRAGVFTRTTAGDISLQVKNTANGTTASLGVEISTATNDGIVGAVQNDSLVTASSRILFSGDGNSSIGLIIDGSGTTLPKLSAAPGVAPGAGRVRLFFVAGTTGGSCKLQAQAGTSTTASTIFDNIGSGC